MDKILPGQYLLAEFPLLKDTGRTKFLRRDKPTVLFSPFVDRSSPNLEGMYGTGGDGSLQRHLRIDDILFQSGDICNKVA